MTKPVFVFDGDCTFCKFWVGRWKKRVGSSARFAPFQTEAKHHPEISEHEFHKSSQLLMPDGARYSGAAGVFRLLSLEKKPNRLFWCYQHVPGFRFLAERIYKLVSSCRVCAWKFTKMLFPSAKDQEETCET